MNAAMLACHEPRLAAHHLVRIRCPLRTIRMPVCRRKLDEIGAGALAWHNTLSEGLRDHLTA
jgi:hypothetical protein